MALVFTLEPIHPATGERVMLRFTGEDDDRLTGLDDERWWPGIVQNPALNREGWNFNFDGSISIAQAAVDLALVALKEFDPASPAYRYSGAPLVIYSGEAGAPWAEFEPLFVGLVLSTSIEGGTMRVTAQVDSEPFEASVLETLYGGFGDDTGVSDLAEQPKPLVMGMAMNVEPVLIDVVNNVFQVHGYGSIQAIAAVYERGVHFGASVGDFATYGLLVAADIPEGRWGSCTAHGMFRMGAPPYGLITADVEGDNVGGYHQSTAEVMLRLCEICNVPPERIDTASIAALDAAVPYPINLYQRAAETLIDVLARLVQPCNAHIGLSWTGLLQVTRFGAVPAPTLTLDVQGRQLPPVLGAAEQAVPAPFWRLEMTANRNWRPMSKDEIALEEAEVARLPITVWRHYPVEPPTPSGNDTPTGWLDFKPEMSRPNVMDDDGAILFGPVWESHAFQKGGETTEEGWSEPRLDDARYKGWHMAGTDDSNIPLGGADSMRADDPAYLDRRWITRPITGPWRLRFTVRNPLTRAVIGVATSDPDLNPSALDYTDVVTGFALAPDTPAWGVDTVGIYPFANYAIDGGFSSDGYNRSHAAVPSHTTYDITYNGDVIVMKVGLDEVRTYWFNRGLHGDQFWPVFILQTHASASGQDSEIYDIQWEHASPGRVLEFPYTAQTGALKRMLTAPGWETAAPFFSGTAAVGYFQAESFAGGGRVDFRHGGTTGSSSVVTVVEFDTASSDAGRIELKGDGKYTIKEGGDTKKTGNWFTGDLWSINYVGKRVKVSRNGVQLTDTKTSRGQTVTPKFTIGAGGRLYNLRVVPQNEAEYETKGFVTASAPFTPISDASPQDVSGYTIILETADLGITPSTDGDQFVATALFYYDFLVGTAGQYAPDAKVQYSSNGGTSWTDMTGTWSPSPLIASTGDLLAASFISDAVDIAAVGTRRFRLVAKNNVAGTYSVDLAASTFITGEWQA